MTPVYRQALEALADRLGDCEALRGSRILITGATGLIGACLTDALLALNRRHGLGLRLTALCRDAVRGETRFPDPSVRVVGLDIARACPEEPADYIIHAASNAHPAAFVTDPVGTMLGNFQGTLHLLNHLRDRNGRRLLFVSTGEIYGENPHILQGFRETDFGKIDPMNPRSCYPESKRAAETLLASHVRQYGTDALVARLCYVYGPTITPDNSRADAQFLRKALAGEPIVMKSAGSQLRSYCYVMDAVSALLTLLLKGKAGEAYNVANPHSVHTIRQYAETLARLAGVNVVFAPDSEAQRGGSTVTRAVQHPGKLMELGWTPAYSLEDGLTQTLQALKNRE